QRFPFKIKKATVLKNSFQNQRNFILINQGSSHGIRPEMGVISNNGIVGIVHSVSKNYANVISILHQDLKINVRTTKSPAFGSLVWKGGSPLEFKIEDIVTNANLHVGDTIITGGMSFYFPLGIPIGQITHLEKNEENGYFSIDAQLFNDPSQVYYVYVLENQDFEELESLQKNIIQ
ncbi:MAG: rod shape-determining protein MreC, partial [Bacteroidetes bacterium]|nr:rod shape-determining protein MreC [Bacteroidota bacterium]